MLEWYRSTAPDEKAEKDENYVSLLSLGEIRSGIDVMRPLATRNVKDIARTGVPVVNPFERAT